MTFESCVKLLRADIREAQTEAVAAFNEREDPDGWLTELCYLTACRAKYGAVKWAEVAAAVEGDSELPEGRRVRIVEGIEGISP